MGVTEEGHKLFMATIVPAFAVLVFIFSLFGGYGEDTLLMMIMSVIVGIGGYLYGRDAL